MPFYHVPYYLSGSVIINAENEQDAARIFREKDSSVTSEHDFFFRFLLRAVNPDFVELVDDYIEHAEHQDYHGDLCLKDSRTPQEIQKSFYVLTKASDFIVEDVECFSSFEEAKQAFFDWTGVLYEEYLQGVENGTYHHDAHWDQTKIFEI